LHFSNEKISSIWKKIESSCHYYLLYSVHEEENDLVKLSDVLGTTKILSKEDEDLEKSIEDRIGNLFVELLTVIEESELKKH